MQCSHNFFSISNHNYLSFKYKARWYIKMCNCCGIFRTVDCWISTDVQIGDDSARTATCQPYQSVAMVTRTPAGSCCTRRWRACRSDNRVGPTGRSSAEARFGRSAEPASNFLVKTRGGTKAVGAAARGMENSDCRNNSHLGDGITDAE